MSKRTPKSAKAAPQEYRKPRADVYTFMLVVALAMLVTATVALWMLMKDDYNNEIKGGPNPVWSSPIQSTLDPQRGLA